MRYDPAHDGWDEAHDAYTHDLLDVKAAAYRDALAAVLRDRGPFDVCVHLAGVGDGFDAACMADEGPHWDFDSISYIGLKELPEAQYMGQSLVLTFR